MRIYLQIEQLNGDDCDYWYFDSLEEALRYVQENASPDYFFALSTEPVGLPATEYSPVPR